MFKKLRFQMIANTQVELTTQWPHYLGAELFEHMPPRSAELFDVQNLVEHHRSSGHINGANPRALLVLLIRDDDAILVRALLGDNPTKERVLPDVREDRRIGAEETEDFFQLVWGGMAHVVSTIAGWEHLRQDIRAQLTSGPHVRTWQPQTSPD